MIKTEFEDKIILLKQEIEVLNSMSKLRSNEIDEYRSKNSNLEKIINEKSGIEVEFYKLQDILEHKNYEIEEWRKEYNSLEVNIIELRSSQGKLFEYENKIVLLSQEIERHHSMMKIRVEEIEEWKHKFYDLNEKVY